MGSLLHWEVYPAPFSIFAIGEFTSAPGSPTAS